MTEDEAVEALDALRGDDEEEDHAKADEILLEVAAARVAEAYRRARERIGFWYA